MSSTIIHVPDDYDENRTAGTRCGLVFGTPDYDADRNAVITSPDDLSEVTCPDCEVEAPRREEPPSLMVQFMDDYIGGGPLPEPEDW